MGALIRFGLTGLVTTAVSYLVFAGLMRSGVHYAPAGLAAWATSMALGFVLNRRFTFGVTGDARRLRDFAVYFAGATLQLLVGLAGYAVLIGRLNLGATPAFAVNLIFTTAFGFGFQRFVTFARADGPGR